MQKTWKLIETKDLTAQEIMDKDLALLQQMAPFDHPILHLYKWKNPCLTYGYFINPDEHLNREVLDRQSIELAKRPTGGGIIFHLTDYAFSLLLPSNSPLIHVNPLENYAFINQKVGQAISSLFPSKTTHLLQPKKDLPVHSPTFCMTQATPYDLLIEGKKVGGAAQRRTKQGLLHQASLSLSPLCETFLKNVLKNDKEVREKMADQSGYLWSLEADQTLEQGRLIIKGLLIRMMDTF